ncbi:hypothetical protein [Methylobacterium sp. sgz302541]
MGLGIREVVGMLGMTVEIPQNTYGHHHPDFQDGTAGAFGENKG